MTNKKTLESLKAGFGKLKTEHFDFGRIKRFFVLSDNRHFHQEISDRTFQDLDLDELFMFADRTISRTGQQYLYHVLRTIPAGPERAERFEKIIAIINADPKIRDQIFLELASLRKTEAYSIPSLFLEKHLEKPKWFWIVPVMSAISVFSVLMSFLIPKTLLLLVLLLAINFCIHYWNKLNLYQYAGSIPELLKLSQAAEKISVLKSFEALSPGIEESIRTINGLGIQLSLFRLEAKMQSETGQAVEYFVELLKALFLVEPLVLYNVLEKLDLKRIQIQQLYEFVGEVDTAASINFLREDLPHFCLPTITSPRKQVLAADLYHPLIFQSVANDLDLDNRSALLTGSNMSGKTTFIRTIGINTITGQTINTCFAKVFQIPILKVFSAIRIADDLLSERSYYFEEVLTIKALLEESCAANQSLFLLDEMFKGTNTIERIASAKAVLSYLDIGSNITFVATHDLELAALLKDQYSLFHFTEIVQGQDIVFDYRIKPGNLSNTNAIRILELNSYPKEVVRDASETAGRLQHDKSTGRL